MFLDKNILNIGANSKDIILSFSSFSNINSLMNIVKSFYFSVFICYPITVVFFWP